MSRSEVRMGLRWNGRGFDYGWNSGALLEWPDWIKDAITTVCNRAGCWIKGHDRIMEGITEAYESDGRFHCVNCCKSLRPKTT